MDISLSTPAPIFILCCDRSGSSLLRYIIDTHPAIAGPAELNLGQVCRSLYYLVTGTLGETIYAESSEKDKQVIARVRQLVLELMEEYVAAKGKRFWCEKSPQNLQFLTILKAVFPEAKYICLYRHGMDVVHSCLESSRLSLMPEQLSYVCQNSGSIVGGMVQNWVEKTQQILTFEQTYPEQCFPIKYESYVVNPAATLQPMFEFLGVDWDETLLDSVFSTQHDLGPEDPKVAYSNRIHQGSIGKGAQIDTLRIPSPLMTQMNQLLETLSYPTVGADWGIDAYDNLINNSFEKTQSDNGYFQETLEVFPLKASEALISFCKSRLNTLIEELEGRAVSYKLRFVNNPHDAWTIDLANREQPIQQIDRDADCTLTFTPEDALNIVNGNANPIELWMQSKLKVSGDRHLGEIFCWFLVDRLQWRKKSATWWLGVPH